MVRDLLEILEILPMNPMPIEKSCFLSWNFLKHLHKLVDHTNSISFCDQVLGDEPKTMGIVKNIIQELDFVFLTLPEKPRTASDCEDIITASFQSNSNIHESEVEGKNAEDMFVNDAIVPKLGEKTGENTMDKPLRESRAPKFSAADSIEHFMFLRGHERPDPVKPCGEPQLLPAATEVIIPINGPMKVNYESHSLDKLYHEFAQTKKPDHFYLANSLLFQKHHLSEHLKALKVDLIERELNFNGLVIDSNTAVHMFDFHDIPRFESTLDKIAVTDEFCQTVLGQKLLETCIHFSQIHLILENVSPPQKPGKLSVYPFTPPMLAAISQIELFHHSVMKPGFKTNLRIWFSDDVKETAWIIRLIGDLCQECGSETWAFRDWLTEFPTKHESFLAKFPGCNHFIAQLILQKFTIIELCKLTIDELISNFECWVNPSRLV